MSCAMIAGCVVGSLASENAKNRKANERDPADRKPTEANERRQTEPEPPRQHHSTASDFVTPFATVLAIESLSSSSPPDFTGGGGTGGGGGASGSW